MKTQGLQINHPSELNTLISLWLFRKPGRGTIRISPEFKHPEKEQWEAAINRYYYACGCPTSAKGLLIMLVLGVVVSFAAFAFDAMSLKQMITLTIVAAISGAVIGKLVGLANANRRLIRIVHTIQANWKPDDKLEDPIIICG